MNKNKRKENNPDLRTLIRELTNIEPSAFAQLGKGGLGGNVKAGLHEFMRDMLERALGLLLAPNDLKVRLQTEAGARSMGYDARVFNLLQLCAFALARVPRRKRGLQDLALCGAQTNVIDLSRKSGTRGPRSSVAELVSLAAMLFEPEFDAIRDAPGLDASSISVSALMSELLHVKPETLIRLYYNKQDDAKRALLRDPEGQALAGLSGMLTRVLHHYPLIVSQNIGSVRFLLATEQNYSDVDGAAAANLGSLLTLGLLTDGKRDVAFVA